MTTLQVIQFDASTMDNFSYLIYCPETLQGAAVDPSQRPELLLNKAAELGVTLQLLLNTHGHHDHTAGNALVIKSTDAQLAAHPADIPEPTISLKEGQVLKLGNGKIEVMHTPGHSPGSVIFKSGDKIITGDTLFVGRCGRADLPGSNVTELYNSLLRLKELPEETQVYPGHNYGVTKTSSIGWELDNNEYLRCPNLQAFIKLRLGV